MALVAGVFFWLGLVAPLAPAAFVGAALACFLALDGAAARPLAGFLMEGASATKRVGTERVRLETRGSAIVLGHVLLYGVGVKADRCCKAKLKRQPQDTPQRPFLLRPCSTTEGLRVELLHESLHVGKLLLV